MNKEVITSKHHRDVLRKSPLMFIAILATWAVAACYFDIRLVSLWSYSSSFLFRIAVCFFIFSVDIFWLISIYHLFLVVFTHLSRREQDLPEALSNPKVATLYPTMNDFQPEAALSCLNQDYPNQELFILDDSTDQQSRQQIDAFAKEFSSKVIVVRRDDHRGFKAGNINNWLEHYGGNFGYIVISDADGILPPDFVSRGLRYFAIDPRIGFVQACHNVNRSQNSKFVRYLNESIDDYFLYYLPARSRYGFATFFGHAAILRTDICRKIGGFPEYMLEDLILSLEFRKLGYYGYYARDLVCYEDFPPTYRQFKGRIVDRISIGAVQSILYAFPSFLWNRNISLVEKLDLLLAIGYLCLPMLFIPFLIVTHIIMPLAIVDKHYIALYIGSIQMKIPCWPIQIFASEVPVLTAWDLYFITLFAMFSSGFGMLAKIARHPIDFVKHFLKATSMFLSIMLSSAISMFLYIMGRQARFFVTGARADASVENSDSGALFRGINFSHPFFISLELAISITMVFLSAISLNLWLFGLCLPLVMSPIMQWLGSERLVIRLIGYISPISIVLALVSISFRIG